MGNVLFINACVREGSRTRELAGHVLSKLGGEVQEVKLYGTALPPLDPAGMAKRGEALRTGDFSDPVFALARQLAAADTVVIAAPYWDLMFPAVLKSYLEAVTVNGLTFAYGENGIPRGLCRAKKLIYVTTAGGPIVHDFGYGYVSALAKAFYGIGEVACVRAEGLDIRGADVQGIMDLAKASFLSE